MLYSHFTLEKMVAINQSPPLHLYKLAGHIFIYTFIALFILLSFVLKLVMFSRKEDKTKPLQVFPLVWLALMMLSFIISLKPVN